jgi:two-component system response regulator
MRVRDMLPTGNFELLEAGDGLEGYNLLCSEKPNLIVLDFLLPKMSGWDIYQEIQKSHELKTIPLVLMSGRKEEVVEKIPEPFEYFAFIEKPFEQKQLLAAIREAMAKAKQHAQVAPAPAVESAVPADTAALTAEVERLRQTTAQMQAEIDLLKKQLSQVVRFIKQNLSPTNVPVNANHSRES